MTDTTTLRLSFADLHKEIEVVPTLAEKFLSPEGGLRLERARRELATFKSRPDTDFTWEIPLEEPVKTKPSEGHYERKRDRPRQKGPAVVGSLSFRWHMRTGPKPIHNVYLIDNATTQLRIYDNEANELCMWRMEIGLHNSPGCCFHTQVLGTKVDPPFPKSLPVPRLPSFPPTPMTCLEFLLSELFQMRWQQHVERSTDPLRLWRGIQRQRLSSFLRWQLDTIEKSTGSPLVDLKAFPGAEVLMGSGRS